jgi:hypothetical protein
MSQEEARENSIYGELELSDEPESFVEGCDQQTSMGKGVDEPMSLPRTREKERIKEMKLKNHLVSVMHWLQI